MLHLQADGIDKGLVSFELVEENFSPILGLSSSVKLGLISRLDEVAKSSILDEFPECFQGIGCLERQHKIMVDPNATPVVNAARRIPLAMMDRVREEITAWKNLG